MPPTKHFGSRRGISSCASSGPMISASIPRYRPFATSPLIHSKRSFVAASMTPPVMCRPVSCPDSSSISR